MKTKEASLFRSIILFPNPHYQLNKSILVYQGYGRKENMRKVLPKSLCRN